MPNKFWGWYVRNYKVIAPATAVLFLLQLVHLYWMTTNVVFFRAFDHHFWNPGQFWNTFIALVDYTEIPAIVSASVFYIHQLKIQQEAKWRSILFLCLINSQWLHLFWITDEIIYEQFTGSPAIVIPVWLAWISISIDYLEIPVMYDTAKKAIKSLRRRE